MRISSINSVYNHTNNYSTQLKPSFKRNLSADTFVSQPKQPAFTSLYASDYKTLCERNSSFAKAMPKEVFDLSSNISTHGLPYVEVPSWKRTPNSDIEGRIPGLDKNKNLRAIMEYEPSESQDLGPDFMPKTLTVLNPKTKKRAFKFEFKKSWHLHSFTPKVVGFTKYYEDGLTPEYKAFEVESGKGPWKVTTILHYSPKGNLNKRYVIKTGLDPAVKITDYNKDEKPIASSTFTFDIDSQVTN